MGNIFDIVTSVLRNNKKKFVCCAGKGSWVGIVLGEEVRRGFLFTKTSSVGDKASLLHNVSICRFYP